MHSNLKRAAAVAAISAVGLLAPAAGASAAGMPTRASSFYVDVPGFGPGSLSFIGPSVWGGASAVIGPTVYTVGGGNVFVGTTITTTAGAAVVTTGPGG
jgi:hypothetical protein